jgi:zinc transporter, ZIP family
MLTTIANVELPLPEIAFVLLVALLPAVGNMAGVLLAESLRAPQWLIGASLHAAAGIAIAVVSIELMPRILQTTPMWVAITAFLGGALISIAVAHAVRGGGGRMRDNSQAWMVYVAIASDVFSDGVMTGVGSAVATGVGFLLAVSQSVANIPGGFAAAANLRDDGVARSIRLVLSASLVVPVLVSAGLSFWLLRDAGPDIQNAALAVLAGILLVTTVEDVVPEADAPQAPRWISTMAFAGGFAMLGLMSAYLQ